jgi:ATP-binding cassette subfamily B protein
MEQVQKNNFFTFLNRLWFFTKSYRLGLFFSFILMSIATLVSLIPPYIIISLINNVLVPIQNGNMPETKTIQLYIIELLGAAILTWIFSSAKTYLLASISEKMTAQIRVKSFKHLLGLSLEFFNQKRLGDLLSRVGYETEKLNSFISLSLLDFIQDTVLVIMILIIMLKLNFKLAVVSLMPMPFVILLILLLKNKMYLGFEQADKIWSYLMSVLSDVIRGIRVVKSFGQESNEIQKFTDINQKNILINNRMNKIWSVFSPTGNLFNELGLILIWGFGIKMMIIHQVSLGELTGFIAYTSRLYSRFESMARFVEAYKRASVSLKRIFELLNQNTKLIESPHPISIKKIKGEIKIQNVNFFYEQKQILKDINFVIRPKEKVGIVGYSGAGKSTLINLICRFFDPHSGDIFLDGINLRDIAIHDYRTHMGVVLQENFLFYGTIAENIAYGKPDASLQDIIAAAKLAHCHQFIMQKPLAYQTLIQENGSSLSGGERQRIAIARAILSKPDILVFDEATSAVDIHTENEIQKAFNNLSKNITSIVISHRLSSLQHFDKLIMVHQGQVIEIGNHQELMNQKGFYYEFFETHKKLNREKLL